MNAPKKDPELQYLEQRARALYLKAGAQLDAHTAGRLRAARREALQAAQAKEHAHPVRMLLPAGAFAVLALAVTMLWLPQQHGAPITSASSTSAASPEADSYLPPDAESADPKLYQNLDFYGWLASNDGQSSGTTTSQ